MVGSENKLYQKSLFQIPSAKRCCVFCRPFRGDILKLAHFFLAKSWSFFAALLRRNFEIRPGPRGKSLAKFWNFPHFRGKILKFPNCLGESSNMFSLILGEVLASSAFCWRNCGDFFWRNLDIFSKKKLAIFSHFSGGISGCSFLTGVFFFGAILKLFQFPGEQFCIFCKLEKKIWFFFFGEFFSFCFSKKQPRTNPRFFGLFFFDRRFFFRRDFEAFSISWGAISHFLQVFLAGFWSFSAFLWRFSPRSFELFSKKFFRIFLEKKKKMPLFFCKLEKKFVFFFWRSFFLFVFPKRSPGRTQKQSIAVWATFGPRLGPIWAEPKTNPKRTQNGPKMAPTSTLPANKESTQNRVLLCGSLQNLAPVWPQFEPPPKKFFRIFLEKKFSFFWKLEKKICFFFGDFFFCSFFQKQPRTNPKAVNWRLGHIWVRFGPAPKRTQNGPKMAPT